MTRIWAILSVSFACVSGAQADSPVVSRAGLDGFVTVDRLPAPTDPILLSGRMVWGDSCENCHGGNKAVGAPKITSTKAWSKRIAKGMPTLIDHALNGFIGPRYTQMPPRGANPDLTDAEVAAAVAFMVWTSGGAELAKDYIAAIKRENQ